MKGTPRKRITDVSSLNEISTDQLGLGDRLGVGLGGGGGGIEKRYSVPSPPLSTAVLEFF
jgi:hypothetical protein